MVATNPQYQLSDAETKREALGRSVAMVGSIIGLIGTGMLLSVNPAVKTAAGNTFRRLPASVQRNKTLVLVAVGGLVVAGLSAWYTRKLKGK